jgi:hypothetical protein
MLGVTITLVAPSTIAVGIARTGLGPPAALVVTRPPVVTIVPAPVALPELFLVAPSMLLCHRYPP